MAYYLGLNTIKKTDDFNEVIGTTNTIEWTLESPIPMHAYNSLPTQS